MPQDRSSSMQEDNNVSTASWSVIPSKSLLASPSVCPSKIPSLLPSKSPSAIPQQVSVGLSHHVAIQKHFPDISLHNQGSLDIPLNSSPFVSSLSPWEVKGAVKTSSHSMSPRSLPLTSPSEGPSKFVSAFQCTPQHLIFSLRLELPHHIIALTPTSMTTRNT